jgi:putative flippase GtrA
MYSRTDFILVTIIGFSVGLLVLIPAGNLGVAITPLVVVASVVGFSLFAPCALAVLKLLSRRWRVFEQFGKFAAVGTLNTLLDLGILNGLMLVTGTAAGSEFSAFKTLSFIVATTNSYFWNKLWTFQSGAPVTAREYLTFALFTLCGALINVGVASVIVNAVGAPEGASERLWANVGALLAVAASFIWNFVSYRLVVFKKTQTPDV